MKPTWEQLAMLAHPSVFIASIDCGAEKEICRSHHITSYPTFRYYLNGIEQDYNGAWSLEALRDFVDTTLAVQCNPIEDAKTCSDRSLKYAEKWMEKSSMRNGQTMILNEIDRLEKMMLNAESSTTTQLRRWIRQRRDILKIIQEHKVGLPSETRSNDEF
eukprot:CCRYP_004629-RA/>CCRYP_004629-RA protein AED:0.32 eAED:0.33 QI:0/0/0/1/1/1/2/0/159